ncbi:unnamed protein product [Sphagnum balticum]
MGSRIGEEEDSRGLSFCGVVFRQAKQKIRKREEEGKKKKKKQAFSANGDHVIQREREREREILKGRKETRRSPRTRREEGPRRGTESNNASTRRQTR